MADEQRDRVGDPSEPERAHPPLTDAPVEPTEHAGSAALVEPVAPAWTAPLASPEPPAQPRPAERAETVAMAAAPPEPLRPVDPSILFTPPQPPRTPAPGIPYPPPGSTGPGTFFWQNGPLGSAPSAPPEPVAVPVPTDRGRAATVALMNLSGLGLGYALMRCWRPAAVCWIATVILLIIALPAESGGVPGAVLAVYLIFLALAAVHGAVRGLRTPLAWPPRSGTALGLAVALLVVPIGGPVLFHSAQQEAVQQMLLDRLAQADQTIAGAESDTATNAEPLYDRGLATYADLLHNHATSRAGKLIPGRLTAFYEAVGAPFAKADDCGAVEPLKFLRTVPRNTALTVADLGQLATWSDDRLATSLYECGMSAVLGGTWGTEAVTDLNELLATFPTSAQAHKVGPTVADAVKTAEAASAAGDPCTATGDLSRLHVQVSELKSADPSVIADLKKDTDTLAGDVETGTFDCDVSLYKSGKFSDAQTAMDSFVTSYPNDRDKALAQKFSIAAQIAQHSADAGKVIPTLTAGGSVTVTFLNDSPDPTEMLYTGPATGSVELAACPKCTVYQDSILVRGGAPAPTPCTDSTIDYPTVTITLPPGTTYFFQKSTGTTASSAVQTSQFDADTSFDECAYTTKPLGLGTGL